MIHHCYLHLWSHCRMKPLKLNRFHADTRPAVAAAVANSRMRLGGLSCIAHCLCCSRALVDVSAAFFSCLRLVPLLLARARCYRAGTTWRTTSWSSSWTLVTRCRCVCVCTLARSQRFPALPLPLLFLSAALLSACSSAAPCLRGDYYNSLRRLPPAHERAKWDRCMLLLNPLVAPTQL